MTTSLPLAHLHIPRRHLKITFAVPNKHEGHIRTKKNPSSEDNYITLDVSSILNVTQSNFLFPKTLKLNRKIVQTRKSVLADTNKQTGPRRRAKKRSSANKQTRADVIRSQWYNVTNACESKKDQRNPHSKVECSSGTSTDVRKQTVKHSEQREENENQKHICVSRVQTEKSRHEHRRADGQRSHTHTETHTNSQTHTRTTVTHNIPPHLFCWASSWCREIKHTHCWSC